MILVLGPDVFSYSNYVSRNASVRDGSERASRPVHYLIAFIDTEEFKNRNARTFIYINIFENNDFLKEDPLAARNTSVKRTQRTLYC